ncbi:transposase, MuDR, MULE transposase domain protein [Tanacetum coccineum]
MLVGHMLLEKLRNNKRVYSRKDIQNDFRLDWKIDISYKRAWSGKNVALEMLNGSQENSFGQLPLYCHNLKLANDGTVTHIQTNDNGTFKKCFIGFGVSIQSFLYYIRPLIKIDGAHLKGTYIGTNLLAVGMDANNQIIPLATGVAQGETVENWSWFLTKLKECIGDVPNLAIISDRHYSITIICRTIFPQAFHGFCCRHLLLNCNLKSKKHKAMYWKTCKAYLERDFKRAISDTRGLRPDAYRKLEEAGFDRWSRAYCPGNIYNYMTSNSVESINSLTKHVRKVPITMLMEYYRELIQRWYFERRFNNEDEPPVDELSRWAAAKVSKRNRKSANWIMNGIEHLKMYHVKDHKAVHVVDLSKGECSCRKWQLSGLPCGHVCAVSRVLNMSNSNRWAKAWFSRGTLKATYQQLVYPLPGQLVSFTISIPNWH